VNNGITLIRTVQNSTLGARCAGVGQSDVEVQRHFLIVGVGVVAGVSADAISRDASFIIAQLKGSESGGTEEKEGDGEGEI